MKEPPSAQQADSTVKERDDSVGFHVEYVDQARQLFNETIQVKMISNCDEEHLREWVVQAPNDIAPEKNAGGF